MPSEARIELALGALATPIERYRSAVVKAAEEVRGVLDTRRGDGPENDGLAAGLGVFAQGRIDVNRFATLLSSPAEDEGPGAFDKLEKAFEILGAIASDGSGAFYLKLSPGVRLRDAVASRFADIGRAFAATRIAGLAAIGALASGNPEEPGPLGFDAWSSGERSLAPPLVVELEGADLHAADLAEFLDGSVKILLLVNGESPPAPLVRLVTPRTFVLQTNAPEELERLAAADPPAVAALMPEAAARFVHDPSLGQGLSERLTIHRLPERAPMRKLGGMSPRQQQEELDQLRAVASPPALGAVPAAAGVTRSPMTSVDKLASWLLSQTDLSGAT